MLTSIDNDDNGRPRNERRFSQQPCVVRADTTDYAIFLCNAIPRISAFLARFSANFRTLENLRVRVICVQDVPQWDFKRSQWDFKMSQWDFKMSSHGVHFASKTDKSSVKHTPCVHCVQSVRLVPLITRRPLRWVIARDLVRPVFDKLYTAIKYKLRVQSFRYYCELLTIYKTINLIRFFKRYKRKSRYIYSVC